MLRLTWRMGKGRKDKQNRGVGKAGEIGNGG